MKYCETCKYWNRSKSESVNPELCATYDYGWCSMPQLGKPYHDAPIDGVQSPADYCAGHGDYRIGAFVTGIKFGCINHKERE